MPYTNIEARRKNQREWVAKKRARASAESCKDCEYGEDFGGCESTGARWNEKKGRWTPTKECIRIGHLWIEAKKKEGEHK